MYFLFTPSTMLGVLLRPRLCVARIWLGSSQASSCLVGMEACGSAHHWAREIGELGHEVRLMPPACVKAYVQRQKNDAADATAICEAVNRPSMRFVPVRSLENQAALMHHRGREMLVAQRTARKF
jgi:transposase